MDAKYCSSGYPLPLSVLLFYIVSTHTYQSFNGRDRDGARYDDPDILPIEAPSFTTLSLSMGVHACDDMQSLPSDFSCPTSIFYKVTIDNVQIVFLIEVCQLKK